MKKENIVPLDLHHLLEKLLLAQRCMIQYRSDRSDGFKKNALKKQEDIIDVCIRDIEYLLDTKNIGGYEVAEDTSE